MTGHWHLIGTEGRVHIFTEAERVARNWGKKGLKWHSVTDWVLAEQVVQVFQLLAVRGCAGKNLTLFIKTVFISSVVSKITDLP